jgi:hypothetical protein
MPNNERPQSPRVAAFLNKRLAEMDMTRSDFIRKIQTEFEVKHKMKPPARNHLFKILNGSSIAGEKGLLPYIVKSLKLEFDEVQKLLVEDKMEAKFGFTRLPKASPIVQQIAAVVETLSKHDQEEILQIAKMKAGQ